MLGILHHPVFPRTSRITDHSEYPAVIMSTVIPLPSLDELPLKAGDPPNSAWGLWGPGDKLGSLNYLTDEAVLTAVKEEVQTGARVGLEYVLCIEANSLGSTDRLSACRWTCLILPC
jgi:hypothetical protein